MESPERRSSTNRPFEGEDRRRRVAPYAFASAVAVGAAVIAGPDGASVQVVIAAALFVALAVAVWVAPWSRLPADAQVVPVLAYIAAVALLRHDTGGSESAFSALAALPLIWVTIYGTLPQIAFCLCFAAVALGAPSVIIGEPDDESADLLRSTILVAIGAALAFSTHRLLGSIRAQESQTHSIISTAQDSFVSVDDEGRIVLWNQQAERDFGFSAEEAIGQRVVDLVVPPARRVALQDALDEAARTGHSYIIGRRMEVEGLRRDGSEFPVELTISLAKASTGLRFNAFLHDISERREADAQVQAAEERFRRAFDDAAIGMALTSPGGRWLRVNSSLSEMLGYSVAELTGLAFRDITHPEHRDVDMGALEDLRSGRIDRFQAEKRYFHSDGTVIWVDLNVSAVREPSGRLAYLISQMQDVTERREAQERLAHQASHDPLTGLPNRMLLDDRMSMALARLRRAELPLAVLFLDLDRFKLINDSLGHDAGDQLLVEVSRRLGALLRPSDTVARLGGDEFAILCEGVTPDGAATLARRIGESLAEELSIDGHDLAITTSIGIAIDRDPDVTPGTLLANADAAMYEAKTRGRSRYAFFATEMRTRASGRLEAEAELRAAVAEGAIEVHFQPQVELSGGQLIGVEALARWRHPELGLLPAADFIPLAEESDLIVSIGDRVLEETISQALRWREEGGPPLRVTVNLSGRQLTGPELSGTVAHLLAKTGFEPELLCLEMTDRTFAGDPEGALEAMADLRDLGVTLAIDEFGVGTSNLGLLRGMPEIGVLKIDPSFVKPLEGGRAERDLVAAVIHMAHALGMEVIAEGVETAVQAGLLRDLGCDAAQGNHLGRPVPARELAVAAGRTGPL